MSVNFAKLVRKHGFWATVLQAKKLGIDFVDCYQMAFGRLPKGFGHELR